MSLGALLAFCLGLGILWAWCAGVGMNVGAGVIVPMVSTHKQGPRAGNKALPAVLLADECDHTLEFLSGRYEEVYGSPLPDGSSEDIHASLPGRQPHLYNLGVRKGGTGSLVRVLTAAGVALKNPGGSAETHFWSRLHRVLVHGNGEPSRASDLGSQFLKHVETAHGTTWAAEASFNASVTPFDLYRSLFPPNDREVGSDGIASLGRASFYVDKSTENWCLPALPTLLRIVQPKARLTILLRDPVARAYSDAAFTARVQRRRAIELGGLQQHEVTETAQAHLRRLGLFAESAGRGKDHTDDGGAEAWALPTWFHTLVEPAIAVLGGPGAPLSERRLGEACGSSPGSEEDLGLAFVLRGVYAPALERWARVWGPSAVLVLRTEDLSADPAGLVRRIATHTGVSPDSLDAALPGWTSRATTAAATPFTHCSTDEACHAPPPPMHPTTHALLAAFYAGWNERLAVAAHNDRFLEWNRPM